MEDKQVKKEFPGLYSSEASCRSDSDYNDNSYTKGQKKDFAKSKKKEKNKDKGYAALDSQSSGEEMDLKNPLKSKRTKSFKFLQKKDKEEDKKKKDKEEDKKKKEDKDDKKKEKKREKEERKWREKEERRRVKSEKKKKLKPGDEEEEEADKGKDESFPLFGVPLSIAVERNPCFDGIRLPAIVRLCIDFIEEKGLTCEGIYRISGSKSKVNFLRRTFNCGQIVLLEDHHPHNVASLLKQYLKELPETVLTVDMMPHFEDVSLIPNPRERAEAMRQLIEHLPTPNRLLLQYMLKHMAHVIETEEAKMSYHNVCVILSPIMQISHRVLNVMFHSHHYLVRNVVIKKYIPPITSVNLEGGGGGALDRLQTSEDIEEEISKQECLLSHIHTIMSAGQTSHAKEEMMWDAQRVVTLLKRMLKNVHRRDQIKDSGGLNRLDTNESDAFSEDSQKDSTHSTTTSESKIRENVSTFGESTGGKPTNLNSAQTSSCDSTSVEEPLPTFEKSSVEENDKDKPDDVSIQTSNHGVVSVPVSNMENVSNSSLATHKTSLVVKVSVHNQSPVRNSQERVAISSIPKDGSQKIPFLPKPLSSKAERAKLVDEKEENSPSEPPLCYADFKSDSSVSKPLVLSDHGRVDKNSQYSSVMNHLPQVNSSGKPLNNVNKLEKSQDHIGSEKQLPDATQGNQDHSTDLPVRYDQHLRIKETDTAHFHSVNAISQGKVPEICLDESTSWDVLMVEDQRLKFEHEELLNLNQELTRKLQFEKSEIARLKDEIQEIQTLYGYRIHSYDSSESGSEDSDDDSEDECDIFTNISRLQKYNTQLMANNSFIIKKIQSEREAIVRLKVALRGQHELQTKSANLPLPLC